ncbi:isochorismate synthase [Ulvibacter litoralis]|uniref:isochorismate synthase n=1 Tax=Ulvibacter litoralis TaxID=227084 RepID=A0A1G7HLA0_9FLAO|nr:isochorismate synthase [Ulvibacter litoralis]GHC58137.1 hypothetical protein GCM10008083_23510 [Ulvibacter litoralis]SDF00769.1 isochorismate synthase [Ulvibacter litoralis]
MEYSAMLEKIKSQYDSKIPFSIYSLPDSDTITCYFQIKNEIMEGNCFLEQDMLFAPFDSEKPLYCIPANKAEVVSIPFPKNSITQQEVSIDEKEEDLIKHLKLVKAARDAIKNKKANKIVVSRKKDIVIQPLDFSILLNRLFNLFSNTYRYLWYHPDTGLWCGATPETLVKTEGLSFTTMALAGTQKVNSKRPPDWTSKEITEQQYVTDAITTSLQRVTSVVKISKTYTQLAGSLAHLRTDISGVLKNGKATLATISNALHPTPAVCGTPTKFAKSFIAFNEGYDREFYTGFTGPINPGSGDSQLFVNLRCLKIEETTATLYVGGGITIDSEPEKEWEETKNKMQTMLQVLQPFL